MLLHEAEKVRLPGKLSWSKILIVFFSPLLLACLRPCLLDFANTFFWCKTLETNRRSDGCGLALDPGAPGEVLSFVSVSSVGSYRFRTAHVGCDLCRYL